MILEVRLRHRFDAFALDAEFRVDRPGVTALFGPSGAGKSTIADAVAGLFRPVEGRLAIGEQVVFDSRAHIFVPPRARRIGYVFQDPRLFPHMTVENNLRFGWRRARSRANAEEISRVIEMLGLEPLLARKPVRLSGGEKSRVALGRALLSSPNLLILDEPLAALDAARKSEILPWFEKLRSRATVPMIYVTHSVDEVARLADTVVLIREGRVAAYGSAFDLLPDLEFTGLTGENPIGAVFPAKIASHRDPEGLSELAFDGGMLFVPRLNRPIGAPLRVRLKAEDVMLARTMPSDISANNVLSAKVAATRNAGGVHADVQLACGGVKIVARITRASLDRLEIQTGMPLFAVVKSVTVDLY